MFGGRSPPENCRCRHCRCRHAVAAGDGAGAGADIGAPLPLVPRPLVVVLLFVYVGYIVHFSFKGLVLGLPYLGEVHIGDTSVPILTYTACVRPHVKNAATVTESL